MAKVPVVTGQYVVEELEESERESNQNLPRKMMVKLPKRESLALLS